MKKVMLALLVLVGAGFGLVTPYLESHIANVAADVRLPVHIVLKEQFDSRLLNSLVDGLPKVQRRMEVARILQAYSAEKQADLLALLDAAVARGEAADVRSLWVLNAIYCEATPALIRALAERPEVSYVNYDLAWAPDLLEPEEPTDETDEVAWGVQKVNAPAVWALGYTGQGVVCGHIDTGCNYNHPDLADHMWTDPNYPNHGWNFENNTNDPNDGNGHGTHTAGSVASDGTAGSQCGVAPDAQIMVCRVRTVADSVAESQCWQAMQFCVSPPLSPANGADLYTMSLGWQISWNPHQASWRQAANNVNAAGLSQIVAAGNERSISPPNSCRCPGNVPPPWWNPQNTGVGALSGIVSIGATTSADQIASFSSRGPCTWSTVAPFNDYPYPPGLTRPDVSAPGDNIKSCARTGGYTTMSGTSMATPHVAGTVCLMLSKNPNLSPAVVDSILETTALDLGPTGKDNDFGAGRIDALAAVNAVGMSAGPPILNLVRTLVLDGSGNNNGRLDPGETADLQMTLRNNGGANCNNTVGTFISGDARLTVLDANGAWGNINRGDTATNAANRFTVRAGSSIPNGTAIPCTLRVTGDSADYATQFVISLVVGLPPTPGAVVMDHDTGYCKLSVTCLGSIGYDLPPAEAGSGFCYPKTSASQLFYSSLAIGTDVNWVADHYFGQPANGAPNADFRIAESLRALVPPQYADEQFRGVFTDAAHPSPKGLRVVQHSYQNFATGYDDFVALVYDITNDGSAPVNGIYAGVFSDFDLGTSSSNTAGTDTVRRLAYMRTATSPNPTVGVKILYPYSWRNLTCIDHAIYVYPTDSCVTDNQKFRFLNGTIVQRSSNRSYDWSVVTSVGPFDLAVGQTQRFAVAFVGGSDENVCRAHADSAQSWYDRTVGIAEGPRPVQPRAQQLELVPNPFTGRTLVSFALPTAGRVRVAAFDATGREVARIFDGTAPAGRSVVAWQPRGLAGGVYFIKLAGPGLETTQRALLLR